MYPCRRCGSQLQNILEYCRHLDWHIRFKFKNLYTDDDFPLISDAVLQYLMDEDIAPPYEAICSAWDDNCWATNDGDVLYWSIEKISCEYISIGILERLNVKKIGSGAVRCFDDEDYLREHLLNRGIIDNLYLEDVYSDSICGQFSFEEWREFCHFTNTDILMHCIKKGWNKFCMKLLVDFDCSCGLYDVFKKNYTNAYDLAIKHGMKDVAERILELQQTNK